MSNDAQAEDDWPTRLRGAEHNAAIGELRVLLVRGLSKSLTNRYGQPFSVDDIVQDSLLKILETLDQFEGRSRFLTWAMTVATRIGISSLRRKYQHDVSMEAIAGENGTRLEFAAEIAESSDDRALIVSKMQGLIDTELTDKQRTAIRAVLVGHSTDDIAEQFTMTRNAVYKLIHDARAKLRASLERDGVTANDVDAAFV